MATQINELSVWDNNIPVVTIGDPEFETWNDGMAVVDQDESNPNQTTNRRRPHIY